MPGVADHSLLKDGIHDIFARRLTTFAGGRSPSSGLPLELELIARFRGVKLQVCRRALTYLARLRRRTKSRFGSGNSAYDRCISTRTALRSGLAQRFRNSNSPSASLMQVSSVHSKSPSNAFGKAPLTS